MVPVHHVSGLVGVGTQPAVVQFRGNDHRGAFFIPRFVELTQHRVLTCIDGEHGKADHQFTGRPKMSGPLPWARLASCGLQRGESEDGC